MYLGFSVSSKPNFKNPTGSINASVGRIDSKWKSVTHQAGIYAGEDGYDIHVGNGTTLEGAVINSAAPKAKNTLTTKSLEMKDIQNEAEYTYSNNGIGYNYYGSKKKLEEMKTNDKKGYDKIYNSIGLVPNLGVGSKGKASSTTQSAISDGILTVDGKVAKSIAHGIIGEVAARMAGNAPGSGFKANMTNELLIGEIKKVAKHDPAVAQWLSAAVGGVVNKASGEIVNVGAGVSSYATKWNEGLFHIDRVDLDGISEDNKDLALADLNYDLAQSNRYNINKLREKKKYIRKDHLYSESKGIGAGITDVVGI